MTLPDISSINYQSNTQKRRFYSNWKIFCNDGWFYIRYTWIVIWSGLKFLFTQDPQKAVTLQARRVIRLTETQGISHCFEGLNHYPAEDGPYVFACNHMGTFEVNALPGLIASRLPMTFVVKASLLKAPFFGQVLKRLNAIPVRRRHPGEDLKQVLDEGTRYLSQGVSIILFPESTRQDVFAYSKFNSLAVKLALRANVPVVPVALKTDFWGVGKYFRSYGPLKRQSASYIAFGYPIRPSGRGKAEHREVLEFISAKLEEWGSPVQRDSNLP